MTGTPTTPSRPIIPTSSECPMSVIATTDAKPDSGKTTTSIRSRGLKKTWRTLNSIGLRWGANVSASLGDNDASSLLALDDKSGCAIANILLRQRQMTRHRWPRFWRLVAHRLVLPRVQPGRAGPSERRSLPRDAVSHRPHPRLPRPAGPSPEPGLQARAGVVALPPRLPIGTGMVRYRTRNLGCPQCVRLGDPLEDGDVGGVDGPCSSEPSRRESDPALDVRQRLAQPAACRAGRAVGVADQRDASGVPWALSLDPQPALRSEQRQQSQQRLAFDRDATDGRRKGLAGDVQEDRAARAGDGREEVVADDDQNIVDIVLAPELFDVGPIGQAHEPVVLGVLDIVDPGVVGRERAHRHRGRRQLHPIGAKEPAKQREVPDRRCEIALALEDARAALADRRARRSGRPGQSARATREVYRRSLVRARRAGQGQAGKEGAEGRTATPEPLWLPHCK